jgi:hypothetical protein
VALEIFYFLLALPNFILGVSLVNFQAISISFFLLSKSYDANDNKTKRQNLLCATYGSVRALTAISPLSVLLH